MSDTCPITVDWSEPDFNLLEQLGPWGQMWLQLPSPVSDARSLEVPLEEGQGLRKPQAVLQIYCLTSRTHICFQESSPQPLDFSSFAILTRESGIAVLCSG